MTIGPLNQGHALVVPVRHAPSLAELDPEDGAEMFRVAQRVAAAIRASGLRCEGINFIYDDGAAAMQTVFHAHLHVVPRFFGDGIRLVLPPGFSFARPRPPLDEAAALIRAALERLDEPQ
jgi:histidine triad (HIT) family protein